MNNINKLCACGFSILFGSTITIGPIAAFAESALYAIDNQAGFLSVIDPIGGTARMQIEIVLNGEIIKSGNGLAVHPVSNEMYAAVKLENQVGPGRNLIKIDPETGAATNIGTMVQPIASLAFDLNGVLYGVSGDCLNNCGGAAIPETLFIVNATNASLTSFQTLGNGDDGEAIAFNPNDGMMYHLSGKGAGLIFEKINLSTGAVTPIPLSGSPVANLEAIGFTFDPVQNLFVGSLIDWDECFCDGFFITLAPGGFLTTVTPLEIAWKDFAFYKKTFDVLDVTDVVDISGDAVPDVAVLSQQTANRPRVDYYSGNPGEKLDRVNYLSPAWTGIAAATLADSNQDSVRDDPAVAVLGRNIESDKLFVQLRMADGGNAIAGLSFLSASWTPVDLVIVDDANGDGISNDSAIGVLGINPNRSFRQRNLIQLRRLSDGSVLRNVYIANGSWLPLAAGTVPRLGKSPLLGVLLEKISTKEILVQARILSDASLHRNTAFLSSAWRGKDLAILSDTNGNGVFNDPSYLVLAYHPGNGKNVVQIRRPGGAFVKNIFVLSDKWQSRRLMRMDDLSGNLFEEVGVLGNRNSDSEARVQIKDFDTTNTVGGISP